MEKALGKIPTFIDRRTKVYYDRKSYPIMGEWVK